MIKATTISAVAIAVAATLILTVPGAAAEGPLKGKRVAWVLRGYDGYQQAQSAWFKLCGGGGRSRSHLDQRKGRPVTPGQRHR